MNPAMMLKRGNTAENAGYVGHEGEPTVDTEGKTLRIHDGKTPGGHIVLQIVHRTDNDQLFAEVADVERCIPFVVRFPK